MPTQTHDIGCNRGSVGGQVASDGHVIAIGNSAAWESGINIDRNGLSEDQNACAVLVGLDGSCPHGEEVIAFTGASIDQWTSRVKLNVTVRRRNQECAILADA